MLFLKILRYNLSAMLKFYFGKSAVFKDGAFEFGTKLGRRCPHIS
jgi:hypothetical protein